MIHADPLTASVSNRKQKVDQPKILSIRNKISVWVVLNLNCSDCQVCDMLRAGASYIWDDEMKVPYLVQDDQWVGFDDERSIRHKMGWIKDNGFAGAMVWTVDMDDFTGTICGGGVKYPLIGAMR